LAKLYGKGFENPQIPAKIKKGKTAGLILYEKDFDGLPPGSCQHEMECLKKNSNAWSV